MAAFLSFPVCIPFYVPAIQALDAQKKERDMHVLAAAEATYRKNKKTFLCSTWNIHRKSWDAAFL